MLEPPV